MLHPMVQQLLFARREFARCFEGVPAEQACQRVGSMNCLSWIVGHLACQEQFFWVQLAQGRSVAPELEERVGYRRPPSTPPWDEMWQLWRAITAAADTYLGRLQPPDLRTHFLYRGRRVEESVGTLLLRNTYHYWFHLGKAHSVRQALGHTDLPVYVGDLTGVGFVPEAAAV